MPNTVDIRVLNQSTRHYNILVNILGDASGEETDRVLVDVSALTPACETVRLDRIVAHATGVAAFLEWDATTDDELFWIPDGADLDHSWKHIGGLTNPKSTGFTGDLVLTTVGLGSGDRLSMTLECVKQGVS